MPQTLRAPAHSELLIKKSRFIGCVQPMADRASAQAVVDALRREHPGAAHVCWALLAGGQSAAVDDGEPGGTAGRPILQAIEGQDMDRVAVLVVRWFGGVKLGAGGLVRAYGGCAANCLRLGERTEIVDLATVTCTCGFAELPLLKSRLAQAGAAILQEDFNGEGAALRFTVPRAAAAELAVTVANITRGRAGWDVT
jgi:uncharacterized YigZ family protein